MAEKQPKLKWNQYAIDDDITYLGPLSYRHFKVIGWLLFVTKMIIPPIKLAAQANAELTEVLAVPLSIMELLAPLSVFFLLMASMSQLLVNKDYQKQMLTNGLAALAIIVLFELLYHRYIVGTVDAFVANRDESLRVCNAVFSMMNPAGFVAFNVFLDLFLCTCVMFFLNYKPTKYFVGDKLKWFRCLALLPVVYELVCLCLKLQANLNGFYVPISFFPFLPSKPPMMFFVLCAMIVYVTVHEKRFCKAGRTHEEHEQYLSTNRNSWQFAKFAALACLLAGIIDLLFAYIGIMVDTGGEPFALAAASDGSRRVWVFSIINRYLNAGFGGSVDLVFFAPIMLLFNYAKTYEDTTIEAYIPVGSIVLLLVLYLEGYLIGINALGTIAREEVVPQITAMLEEAKEAGGKEVLQLLDVLYAVEESPTDSSSSQGVTTSQPPAQETSSQAPAQVSSSAGSTSAEAAAA